MLVSVFVMKYHGISVRYVVAWRWRILAGLGEIALPFQTKGWFSRQRKRQRCENNDSHLDVSVRSKRPDNTNMETLRKIRIVTLTSEGADLFQNTKSNLEKSPF